MITKGWEHLQQKGAKVPAVPEATKTGGKKRGQITAKFAAATTATFTTGTGGTGTGGTGGTL
jgi:hypothetical protein